MVPIYDMCHILAPKSGSLLTRLDIGANIWHFHNFEYVILWHQNPVLWEKTGFWCLFATWFTQPGVGLISKPSKPSKPHGPTWHLYIWHLNFSSLNCYNIENEKQTT